MNDAVVLIGLTARESQSSCPGPDFAAYLHGLTRWLDAAGGTVEGGAQRAFATFEDRQIAIPGPMRGHR
jgi:hypothetical protein